MKVWNILIHGLLYGSLLTSRTSSESRLNPSGVKDWQHYFESLPDDEENYRNWLPYLVGYALFVDQLHENIKSSSISSDASSEEQRNTSKKRRSKKYAKSHENQSPPPPTWPAYQPPNIVETIPDFLHDDEGDKHRIVCQELGHANRKRRCETHTDGYEAKRYKPSSSPDSDKQKTIKISKAKRRRLMQTSPEISTQHLLGGKVKAKHRQYRNQTSHSTLKSNAVRCFLVHCSALNHFRIQHSSALYEEAKRHLKSCQRICHRLKSAGDISVCYWYQGKLALEVHSYSKAARFFQRAINKYGPVRALVKHRPSLSQLYVHCSYAFSGAKQYKKAFNCCLLGIETACTDEDLFAAYQSHCDICVRANESAIELVRNDHVQRSSHFSQAQSVGEPLEHKHVDECDRFEKPVEEQGEQGFYYDTPEVCYVYNVPMPDTHMETADLCPIVQSFINAFPSFDEQQLVNVSNANVPEQSRRPEYLVSRDMPSDIRPFVAQYGEQFRGIGVCTAKESTFIVAIHCVHVQPKCGQSSSELIQHSQLIATRHKMQKQSSTSIAPTIHLVCIADTLYVWFRFLHQDRLQICLKECTFNRLLDHLHSGVPLRSHTQGMSPQAIVLQPVLSLSLPTNSPVTFTISHDSIMCIVGNSAASQVKVEGKSCSVYLNALPSAKTEAQGVGYILRTQPLLDEHATKPVVLGLMENSKIIHVAAHGMFYQGCFAIILDPGKDSGNSVITSHDIEKLSLSAVLVVLSCCDSGRSTMRANGIQGMARAFIEAGAQCVLTTQSEVPDKSASVFMQFFYWYLSHGFSSFESLERAKRSMRLFPEYSQSIHWDRYKLHGREITMQWEADQTLSQFGSRSAFPCLQIVYGMEKALVNPSSLPTAVQILCGSATKQVAVDFICTYSHHFKGGVHWISSRQSLKDICEAVKVAQALIIVDRVYDGAGFTGLLRNSNIHMLLLISPGSVETAKGIIQCIRDVQVHAVKLSRMQIQQQIIAQSWSSQ